MSTRKCYWLCLVALVLARPLGAAVWQPPSGIQPKVLVMYDGDEADKNPGRLDAMYLATLLGHFTTDRTIHPIDAYQAGEYQRFDAIFTIVYQHKYEVPVVLLGDIARDSKTFCWLGNQVGQLDRQGILRHHGIHFVGFTTKIKFNRVVYKGRTLVKGDPETNMLAVTDQGGVRVHASVQAEGQPDFPYALQSGNLWIIADSPFSYSAENDRYLVFCDLLHDILGIQHPEDHPALLRIEDINAMSNPQELQATLKVIERHHIPFAFGFVPMYVNPHEHMEFRMADKPAVVASLKEYMKAGGVPVLHGYTHQYRGVTTDDYEFWDDLGDRPVRGDSTNFASRRFEEAIRESMNIEIYPVTWETPHYAASPLDYRVMHRYFKTVFERRLAGTRLDSDQYFPYPVIDLYGQYVIPENLAYVPIEDQRVAPLLDAADAAYVVRDGYASGFFHPFLSPVLLDQLISGIEHRGFHFIDLREFPNEVRAPGRLIKNGSGAVDINGQGRYLNEMVLKSRGQSKNVQSLEVGPEDAIKQSISLSALETFVAWRQNTPPPSALKRLLRIAKGDFSFLSRRLESVFPASTARYPVKTTLLWDSDATGPAAIDQESFSSALSASGYDVDKIEYQNLTEEEVGTFSLLVIPWATARTLSGEEVGRIAGAVRGGISLITDGESPLSAALGIRLGEPVHVETLQDHLFVNQDTRWPDKPSVPWVVQPKAEDVDLYYSDRDQTHPLVIGSEYGAGRYLYFAPLFDDISGQGYARFPNLPQILSSEMNIRPIVRRYGADAYFDPGYRQNISIEVLARLWRQFGIRAVHVAAWHFYEKYTYDYARLVKVAHENGILVYAWYEWPEVSVRFWQLHPAWREKTATLAEAHVDWRYLMNLQHPDCLKAVLGDMKDFLSKYDWDGVDIGELTFESPNDGPDSPQIFTPFNAQARKEFQLRAGFDPLDLFKQNSGHYWKTDPGSIQAFYQYRRDVNSRLLNTFLDQLQRLNAKKGKPWEIIVTMLDALQHPQLSDYLGIDVDRTVALVNRYGATLQAEDPAEDWSKPPSRYIEMGKRYSALKLKNPFMIDINVLPVHESNQKGFATSEPTGVEMFQLWHAAASQAPRVCFYSESTVLEQDWGLMPYAMAADARVHQEGDVWTIDTPNTVRLDVGRDTRRYRLDDQPWFCAEKGEVIVPAGHHTLSFSRIQGNWFDTTQLDTFLLSISGELLGSQRVGRGLEVEYRSPFRCALMFNKAPNKVYLDGNLVKLDIMRGEAGYTLFSPPGQHRLHVICESAGLYLVEFTSLVSASLIVLFGLLSSGLLGFLIMVILLGRRIRGFQSPRGPGPIPGKTRGLP